MATLYGVNYSKSLSDPIEKIAPSELNSRSKIFYGKFITSQILADDDEIEFGFLPEGALVHDAKILISGTMGTGGIINLGHKAFVNSAGSSVVENEDAFIVGADAGGQGVLQRAALGSVLGAALGKIGKGGAQVFGKMSEASTSTDTVPVTIEVFIEYSLES